VNRYKGFTLIEIMVALAVLSISLVVLLGLRNRGISLSDRSRNIIEASILARQKVTEISAAGFADLGEKEGDFGEESPKYLWRQVVVQTPFEAVRELLVQISWKNSHREETVDVTTYLFDSGIRTAPLPGSGG